MPPTVSTGATSVPFRPAPSSAARCRSGPTRTATAASSGARRPADRFPIDGSGARRWLSQRHRMETVMPQIGQFTREGSGFTGRVHTLTLYRELTIVPAEPSDAENVPDYRVHHGADDGPEIGAAWKRTGEKAGEYLSVLLDD